ncbi:hypothetical protein E3N88_25556 [Mikania micrantha]|uniref:Uncharacterized protein n=1 Tax=Mikania micrantha TaxID=192012 RepID=A0A5N6N7W0_9ASTR|nr:hypothetical protein E3N88_25556 [Mikania micrantha]
MVTSITANRFRDHGDDMENGESAIRDTSTKLSSFTSNEDSDIEFDEVASMTANFSRGTGGGAAGVNLGFLGGQGIILHKATDWHLLLEVGFWPRE